MFLFDQEALKSVLESVIQKNTSQEIWNWINQSSSTNTTSWNTAFASMPRKTGKKIIELTADQHNQILSIRKGLRITSWSIDRLCRVYLLLSLNAADKLVYIQRIENLFPSAEMNELVALYSALPVLAYPEAWKKRCAEGIRSNIGTVLESIICSNPYPSESLDEAAWNQLVLKAFFTEKPIERIIRLNERANQTLADTLSDYAHERWAAGRPVHPQLWRCVSRFINENIFPDIKRIALSVNTAERKAAAWSCAESNYPPAKELLGNSKELKSYVQEGINWNTLSL
ncbi:MAG TPA: EboA domain-containing protein [Ohtaekwangia sp.]